MDFDELKALSRDAPEWKAGNLLPEFRPFYEAARRMVPLLIEEVEAARWFWETHSYVESNERLSRTQTDVDRELADLRWYTA